MLLEIFIAFTTVILIFLYSSWLIIAALPEKKNVLKKYPKLSVIIPAYNEEKNIRETLQSVLSADYPDRFEILVVDDGSKDRTAEIVKGFAKSTRYSYAAVKLVKGTHQGKAKAVNLAMRYAKGDILAILDADTLIEKDSLKKLVAPFGERNVGAVATTLRVKKSLNPLTWFQHFEYAVSSSWRYIVDKVNGLCIVPGFCAFRKSALGKVGGFKGDTAVEDYDICLHLMKAGYSIKMAPEAIAVTKVPETFSGLVKQRIRWNRGTIQTLRIHSDLLLKRHTIGLYTMPTQIYWFLNAIIYLPVVLYQIISGYLQYFVSYGNTVSFAALAYFLKWFTVFGMVEFIFNVSNGIYAASMINILTIIIFSLSFIFALFSIIKFSGFNVYSIASLLFFFPYYLVTLVIYLFSMVYELVTGDRGEKWEKSL